MRKLEDPNARTRAVEVSWLERRLPGKLQRGLNHALDVLGMDLQLRHALVEAFSETRNFGAKVALDLKDLPLRRALLLRSGGVERAPMPQHRLLDLVSDHGADAA